jgi:radical SAM protein with 4Fe4S-binding SPASM domain
MKKTFRRAFIEITNGCNLACPFCASSARPIREMTPAEFESAARQAGDLAEMISPHLLGEPLTHSRFPEILACCSRLGLKVNLVTNGLLLRTFPGSLYAEKCLSQISISLHALSSLPPERRAAELEALAAFAHTKPENLTIGFRLRSAGEDDFYRLVVKTLLASFKTTARPGEDHIKLAPGTFLNFGGVFRWPGAPGNRPKRGCLGLRHHFGILSDGRVVPCCADYDGALALGNICERPLAEILSSPAALSLRESISGNTPIPPFCASCGFSPPDS